MAYFLGIDLGGTNIVAGVTDEQYNILAKSNRPTYWQRSFPEIVTDMAATALDALAQAGLGKEDVSHVGVGVPSSINPITRRVVYANNLGWKNADVIGEFQKTWDIPVHLGNDADCAALGECLGGAGQAYQNILMITLGTGVGGGIVLGKKPFLGGTGFGVEPGHSTLVHGGLLCTCGLKGCLEAYASVTALIRQTIDMMMTFPNSLLWEECGRDLNRVDGRTSFSAAARGDAPARQVVDQYITYLASGLASMVNLLRPEAILIGGGVSNAGDALLIPLWQKLGPLTYASDIMDPPPVLKATLGNDAGVIGAAFLGM